MADGRMISMDGPPNKKPKQSSPASAPGLDSNDIGIFLSKFNEELPEELGTLGASPPLINQSLAAAQNGSDRKVDDTIQKNRNLSELLSQETVVSQRTVSGQMGMHRPPYTPGYPNPNIRGAPTGQQMPQRHFAMPSGNSSVVVPGNAPINPYPGMPGGPGQSLQHLSRPNMVPYAPRQVGEFTRVGFDGTNRPFGNTVVPYFAGGPDVRGNTAMMNGASFQRNSGIFPAGPSPASFPQGSGPFPVSNDFGPPGSVVRAMGGGTMFPSMVNPTEMGRSFSPVNAVAGNVGFVNSYSVNNMSMATGNRIQPCSMPNTAGSNMQLVNGSHMPQPSAGINQKLPTDGDVSSKNGTQICQSSNALTNCPRMAPSLTVESGCSAAKPVSVRPSLQTGSKDGLSLESSLVSSSTSDVSVGDVSAVIGTGPASSQAQLDKRRTIQQQLVLVLHAHKCQRREQQHSSSGVPVAPCTLPNCATMKNVLRHMTVCQEGRNCTVPHCTHLRQIIAHWKNCTNNACPICSPLKNASDRRVMTTATTALSTTSTVMSQPVVTAAADSLPPAAPCSDAAAQAEMMRTYKTLGISPPSSLSSSSGNLASNMIISRCNGIATMSEATSTVSSIDGVVRPSKAWHQSVGQDLRNHLVHKLVQAIFPTNPDQAMLRDQRINHLVVFARKVEGDLYDRSSSREEYYQLLAEKIYKIQKELEEKRLQRIVKDQQQSSSANSVFSPSGPSVGPARSSPPLSPLHFADTIMQNAELECSVNSPHQQSFQMNHVNHTGSGAMVRPPQFAASGVDPNDPNAMVRLRGAPYQMATAGLRPDVHMGSGPNSRLLSPRSGISTGIYGGPPEAQPYPSYATPNKPTDQHLFGRMPLSDAKLPFSMQPPQRFDQPITTHPVSDITPNTDSISNLQAVPSSSSQAPLHHMPMSLPSLPATTASDLVQPSSQQPSSCISSSPLSPKPMPEKVSSESTDGMLPNGAGDVTNCSPISDLVSSVSGRQVSPVTAIIKTENQHEDITDDDEIGELSTAKPLVLSPSSTAVNGFRNVEDITDDEDPDVKPPLEKIEIKTEIVIKTEVDEPGEMQCDVDVKDVVVKTEVKEEPDNVSDRRPDETMLAIKSDEVKSEQESGEDVKPEIAEERVQDSSADVNSLSSEPRGRKVWKPAELERALLPTLEKLAALDEAQPFLLPVDPVALFIPDYFEVIKNPIDLSTIRTKLKDGIYTDPWQYINDIQLMFDNAWLYNRKTSKVYKYCSKLAEVFDAEIDGAMRSLGFCCGKKFVFSPQVLCCFGKQLCAIPRDSVYYNYRDRYMYCEKCFNELPGDDIEMADDPSQPGLRIKKEQFVREKNDKLEYEPFVDCEECGRKMHKICVLHVEQVWPSGFICEPCRARSGNKRKENKFTARRMPPTKLGTYLENRVNSLLKRKDAGAGEVTIRVLSSYDKAVEVKPGMKSRFCESGEMAERFPYRVKAIFAFEEIDGVDVCFFGMHVQEYGSDCPSPNTRRVYIAYLDSVHFFQPKQFRTSVYHEILIGYMDYVKTLGYQTAHIWACPPSEGDDYIFHCHPPEQKIPKPKRLQDWYRKMLDKAIQDRVIADYKDIWKDAVDNEMQSVTEMPYFEGDFWPNIIEECIKEIEQEEMEKRRREEEEAAADTDDGESSVHADGVEMQQFAGKKKGQKSGNTKKKNTKSKKMSSSRKSKSGCTDLAGKLLSTMDKHKEGFFVIRLQPQQPPAELSDIKDPDPLMNCDLMDGRDAFLTLSRDKHYEFSSLRRAKYSSVGLLFELHTQARDNFIYNCNSCKASVETRYHCPTCDDFDLCVACYANTDHPHKMVKLGLDLDDGSRTSAAAPSGENADTKTAVSAAEARRAYIQALAHAAQCRNAYCRTPNCARMRTLTNHMRNCERSRNCNTCRQMMQLCVHHARVCTETRCAVPFCQKIREKQETRRREQEHAQLKLTRRRMALMQRIAVADSSVGSNDDRDSTPQPPSVPADTPQSSDKLSQHHVAGKSPPPSAAVMAAQQVEQAAQAQRQANSAAMAAMLPQQSMRQYLSPQHSFDGSGMPVPGAAGCWPQQMTYAVGPGPQASPVGVGVGPQDELVYRQNVANSMLGSAGSTDVPSVMQMQSPQQQSATVGGKNHPALQKLLETLKSPNSPQQQQEVQQLLKTNPEVMATAIKQKQLSQQQQPTAGQINPQMMAGGSMMGQLRPSMSMNPMAMGMVGPSSAGAGGMSGGPPIGSTAGAGVLGPMAAGSGQLVSSMPGSNVMGPGGVVGGQICAQTVGGNSAMGPVMEGMVEEPGRQMMLSPDQMQRVMWMQHQQQQHQMIRGHHMQQEYGHFSAPMQRPAAAAPVGYSGSPGAIPQSQRLRMNIPSVAGNPSPMMPVYPSGTSGSGGTDGNVRGLMPVPGSGGAVHLQQQQQQLMHQMQQQRHRTLQQQQALQVRCQAPMQPPSSMMDPAGTPMMVPPSATIPTGSRAVAKRMPPPNYADTVLTHSGPWPVVGPAAGGASGDPRLQYPGGGDVTRMRFRPPTGGPDFQMVPGTPMDVVRFPQLQQHDPTLRFGDSGGAL